MIRKTPGRRIKTAVMTALLAGGVLPGSACTVDDVRDSMVAGTLDYLAGGAESFWSTFVPQEEIWHGVFNPMPAR